MSLSAKLVIPSKNEESLALQELFMENRLRRHCEQLFCLRIKTLCNTVSKTGFKHFKHFQSFSVFRYLYRLILASFLSVHVVYGNLHEALASFTHLGLLIKLLFRPCA